MSEEPVFVESQLPSDWVPEGAAVWLLVRQCDDDVWETVMPGFSIASQADSPQAAVASAMGLLDDYLTLCYRDGLSFEQAARPMWGPGTVGELLWDITRGAVEPRLRRRLRRPPTRRKKQVFRAPIPPVGGLLSAH